MVSTKLLDKLFASRKLTGNMSENFGFSIVFKFPNTGVHKQHMYCLFSSFLCKNNYHVICTFDSCIYPLNIIVHIVEK